MNDIKIEVTNPPEIAFDVNKETNEVIFEVKSEVLKFNVEGVVYGEKGKDGKDGDNIIGICGENINSHTPVAMLNNLIYKMDCKNNLHQFSFIGFTKTSGNVGDEIEVEAKIISLQGWNLEPNKNYLAGQNGQITTSINDSNSFIKVIGFSQDENTILIYKNFDSILTT